MSFEANRGQAAPPVRYLAHAGGGTLFFTPQELVLALPVPDAAASVGAPPPAGGVASVARVQWVGANAQPALTSAAPLPGQVNYLVGADPAQWHTHVPTYGRLTYSRLYPGVDLVYEGTAGQLKGTYRVAPGADPTRIRWRYAGAERVQVDGQGHLQIQVPPARQAAGAPPLTLTEHAPVVWQEPAGRRVAVPAHYHVAADGTVGFALGPYDPTQPLILDPTLTWEYLTYLGGSGFDEARGIAVDQAGAAYLTGRAEAPSFPASQTIGAVLTTGTAIQAFIVKLNPTGTAFQYATYLGGTASTEAWAVAVDGAGQAVVTGETWGGQNFPTTNGAQGTFGGARDAFVSKLTADGASVVFSTYLGGGGTEVGRAVAVDGAGNVYVTGETNSPAFPTLSGVPTIQSTLRGNPDAFVIKYTAAGGAAYFTYLGGKRLDKTAGDTRGLGITVDGAGQAIVVGATNANSTTQGLPSVHPVQASYGGGGYDAFVTKLNAPGTGWVYASFLGGGGTDQGYGITQDGAGGVYLTGGTDSTTPSAFPVTAGAYRETRTGPYSDAFVAKLQEGAQASAPPTLAYGTYVGGTGSDIGRGIAVTPGKGAWIIGQTASTNFTMTNPLQPQYGGGPSDGFITLLNASGTAQHFATFVGGNGSETGYGIATDAQGAGYGVGATDSSELATTWRAYSGSREAFVVKVPASVGPLPDLGGRPEAQVRGQPCACDRGLDPVNLATGNFVWGETDLAVRAPGPALAWTRTYNSRDARLGPAGRGWSLRYDAHLEIHSSGQITVTDEEGAQAIYTLVGDTYRPPTGELDQLVPELGGTYRLVRPDQSLLRFASSGQLLAVVDAAGRSLTVSYSNGQLSSLRDPAGRDFPVTTDGQGRVTQISDPSLGRSVVYTYTGALLTAVRDLAGQETRYAYTDNLLTQITLADGTVRVENQYDALGRVTGQDAWDTPPRTVTYDLPIAAVNGVPVTRTQVTDASGYQITSDADSSWRLTQRVNATNPPIQVARDGNDRPSVITNALGLTSTQTYNVQGRLLAQRNPLQQGPTYTYDSLNRLRTARDGLNHTTTYTYTTANLLIQETNALTSTTTYTYTTLGLTNGRTAPLLTAQEDGLGHVTQYAYNTLGLPMVITDALQELTYLDYDAAGRLTSIVDTADVQECREYDPDDRLQAVVRNCWPNHPVTARQNVRTEYGYDSLGRPIWERNPAGEVTRTFYGANGQVRAVVVGCAVDGTPSTASCQPYDAAAPTRNRTTEYGYDSQGRPVLVTDTLGLPTRTDYDALDRPWRQVINPQPNGAASARTTLTLTTGYNAAGQVISRTDALGRLTQYQYDQAGRVVTETRNYGDGNPSSGPRDTDLVTTIQYDAADNPITRTLQYVNGVWDPMRPDEDRRQVTRYDALNRPITVVENYVDGVAGANETDTDRLTSYGYDQLGNLLAVTDTLGIVTVTSYDALNRPTETIRNCTDGAGQPRAANCASGHGANNDENIRTSRAYNARGDLFWTTDELGRRDVLLYDELGRLIQESANYDGPTLPAQVTRQYGYDSLGHTTVLTDAVSQATHYSYNAAGWLATVTDPTNRSMGLTYDGLGRRTFVTHPGGSKTNYQYNPVGRLETVFENWQNGQSEPTDGPDQDLETVTLYDYAGQVTDRSTESGHTTYTYDLAGRMTQVTANAGGTIAPADVPTKYGYDYRGLVTTIINTRGYTTSFGYNAAGWPVRTTDALTRSTTVSYDRAGQVRSVSDGRPATVNYNYDGLGRLRSVSATNLATITLQYDLASRRTQLGDATGTTSYQYDGVDRVLTTTHSVDGSVYYQYDARGARTRVGTSHDAYAFSYGYDAAGRLLSICTACTGSDVSATYDTAGRLNTLNRANGTVTTYGYDGANRLTSLHTTQGSTALATFTYGVGRGGQIGGATQTVGTASRSYSYNYDGLNRLTHAWEGWGSEYLDYNYSYDLAGNRLTASGVGPSESRTYDAVDQVVGWSYDAAGNLLNDGLNTYTYDPLKRLGTVANTQGTTSYTYNGDGLLASESSGSTTSRYVLDPFAPLGERLGVLSGGSASWYERGWGQELARVGTTIATMWYLADRQGSVRATLDDSGVLANPWNYQPFGTVLGQGATPPDYGFTGEPHNTSANLVYLRARWYDTRAGRFLTQDPYPGTLDTPMSLPRYLYGNADPVNNTDPTGYRSQTDDLIGDGCPFIPSDAPYANDEPGRRSRQLACDRRMDEYRAGTDPTEIQKAQELQKGLSRVFQLAASSLPLVGDANDAATIGLGYDPIMQEKVSYGSAEWYITAGAGLAPILPGKIARTAAKKGAEAVEAFAHAVRRLISGPNWRQEEATCHIALGLTSYKEASLAEFANLVRDMLKIPVFHWSRWRDEGLIPDAGLDPAAMFENAAQMMVDSNGHMHFNLTSVDLVTARAVAGPGPGQATYWELKRVFQEDKYFNITTFYTVRKYADAMGRVRRDVVPVPPEIMTQIRRLFNESLP